MLVFVYNADAGRLNALLDTAHKILSPATYHCRLCELSYGLFKENAEWQKFRQSLSEPVRFLHRDEFQNQFNRVLSEYPGLLRVERHGQTLLLNAKQINACQTTTDLIRLCQQAIA